MNIPTSTEAHSFPINSRISLSIPTFPRDKLQIIEQVHQVC